MSEKLIIWTYDWVPEGPRGFVRDLRLRWATEEAGFLLLGLSNFGARNLAIAVQ
jgi:hypothetical protein